MKDNYGMVEYARCQLGKQYWYGTYGQLGSEQVFVEKSKQYPSMYPPKKWTKDSFLDGYGQKVHDCIGLFKGYLGCSDNPNDPSTYDPRWDWSANGTIEKCTEKGDIKTIPEIVGLIVWKDGHVGCYVGNGKVIEAKGHAYGVVMSDLKDTKWKMWGKHPYIQYNVMTAVEAFVTRLYKLVLGREPEKNGFDWWVNALNTNTITYTTCAYSFLTSQEFINRNLPDDEFIDVLYRTLFDREADGLGKAYWLNFLKDHSRNDAILGFLYSQEWQNVCEAFR